MQIEMTNSSTLVEKDNKKHFTVFRLRKSASDKASFHFGKTKKDIQDYCCYYIKHRYNQSNLLLMIQI